MAGVPILGHDTDDGRVSSSWHSLDRLEHLLVTEHHAGKVVRIKKPTFAKPAPQDVLDQIRQGSSAGWQQLVERYQGRLLAFARRRIGRSRCEILSIAVSGSAGLTCE